MIQLFTEVRRHKPSVIYIPNVDIWYKTVSDSVISTFTGLLRTLTPTDPVMVLGILECELDRIDPQMISDLFGFSRRNQFEIQRPSTASRHDYFHTLTQLLTTSPADFPEPVNRRRRRLEMLAVAPPEPPKTLAILSKQELKAQKKRDRHLLNILKLRIQPIMDQIRLRHKKFRTGVIDESQIRYLYDEEDPSIVSTDLPQDQRRNDHFRPFEKGVDDHGEPGLIETATGKFFYNMEIVTIEKRLSNGYYKRPKDFLSDVKKLTKDAKAIDDQDRLLKANELQANVEVDISTIEAGEPALIVELEQVYVREMKRERDLAEKQKQLDITEKDRRLQIMPPEAASGEAGLATEQSTGPVLLGEPIANGILQHPVTPSNPSQPSQHSTLSNALSNGISDLSDLRPAHSQSNGTSVPSRDNDLHTSNSQNGPSTSPENPTQDSSFGPSAQSRPYDSTGGPQSLTTRKSIPGSLPGSLSQRDIITPMAEGSIPQDYANYASTTSSEKRNTGSSGDKINTQNTFSSTSSKVVEGPDLSILPEPPMSNSQLPDTQPGKYL